MVHLGAHYSDRQGLMGSNGNISQGPKMGLEPFQELASGVSIKTFSSSRGGFLKIVPISFRSHQLSSA